MPGRPTGRSGEATGGTALSQTAADATRLATERARRAGALISFAVNHRAPLAPDPAVLLDAARDADIVFVSREDAEAVLGAAGEEEALAALERQPGEVVLTAGAAGAVVAVGEDRHRVAAPPIDVVDAAGAGDALAGAYLAERLADRDPRAALAVGVAASVLSCGAHGCAMSYPAAPAVEALASERERS